MPVKTKKGLRYFPPDRPRTFELGYRFGEFYRKSKNHRYDSTQKTGRQVAPHLRRAHWHGYWVGARTVKEFALRWLPPTPINLHEDMPVTIRKIKQKC